MLIARTTTFQGLEKSFPAELRGPVSELIRRFETEIDNIISKLKLENTVTNDTERVATLQSGERVYITHPDGTKELVTVDFGNTVENL